MVWFTTDVKGVVATIDFTGETSTNVTSGKVTKIWYF